MKVKHESTLTEQKVDLENFNTKVTALAYTSDGAHLAVATGDRLIAIFSTESYERVDRFNTKPCNKGPKNYLITSLHFEPGEETSSSCKLAVGQSDAAVFVYKWSVSDTGGSIFQGKKSIVNKFLETAAVVSVVWSRKNLMQCVYALMNGKIKVGNLRSNKSHLLYAIESATVSLALNTRGTELLSGHSDGSVYKYAFATLSKEGKCSKFIQYPQTPYSLTWGRSSICAGGISKITFYDDSGKEEQVEEDEIMEVGDKQPVYTISRMSPNGESLVIGSFDKFYIYGKNNGFWTKLRTKVIENMLSVTSLVWKPDGSSITIGSASGLLDIYSTTWRHYIYKNIFRVTHISPTEVLVHDIETPNAVPVAIQSSSGEEITNLDIYPSLGGADFRYIVATTPSSLILCDMASTIKTSQIPFNWKHGQGERHFIFQDHKACVVYYSGEITVVEYGKNVTLGSFRTQHSSSEEISLRFVADDINNNGDGSLRRIAYLHDENTINISRLGTSKHVAPVNIYHCHSIDFLELSEDCAYCLFRDVKRDLYIIDNNVKTKTHFLASCAYAQWVPLSNMVVAQSKQSMHVWYNTREPEQVVLREIQGEIMTIERKDTNVEVITEFNSSTLSYSLSEELTRFSNAIDVNDFQSCIQLIGKMEESPIIQSLWKQLLYSSLQFFDIEVAYQSAVALSNNNLIERIRDLTQRKEDEATMRFKLCKLLS